LLFGREWKGPGSEKRPFFRYQVNVNTGPFDLVPSYISGVNKHQGPLASSHPFS
jgi:hypothetical protein